MHDVAAEIGSSGQNFTIKVRLAARCDDDGSHHSASFTVAAVEFGEDRRLMGGRDGGFPRDQRYSFDARTPAPEKSSYSVLVTVSDGELDEVTVVSDRRFDTEEKLDALMRNLFVSVTSSEVAPGELVVW